MWSVNARGNSSGQGHRGGRGEGIHGISRENHEEGASEVSCRPVILEILACILLI
jgi:hypothetical protein